MSFYTDWFIADERDAEAIASIITTEERSHDDWPNLSLPNIGELELQYLSDVLDAGHRNPGDVSGKLLFTAGDEGPFVCEVKPAFIDSLAGTEPDAIEALAQRWQEPEEMSSWSAGELAEVLRSLVQFASSARKAGMPVLQMNVI